MRKNRENSAGSELIKGNAVGSVVLIIMTLIMSAVLLKAGISRDIYIIPLLFTAAVSGFAGGYSGTRKHRKNGIVSGLISAALPLVMLLLAMTMAHKGVSAYALIPAAALVAGGAIGGIAAVNLKTKKKKAKK